MGSAHAVQLVLEKERILEKAFSLHQVTYRKLLDSSSKKSHTVAIIFLLVLQDYRLVIVGHSLGAAVASLLAIILKPKYPKLHCFAYSPPGCVIKCVTLFSVLLLDNNLFLYSTAWMLFHIQDPLLQVS